MTRRLRVDPIACSGHGLCAELLPELITLDEWGYPQLADPGVPDHLRRRARRAVTDCPALALQLTRAPVALSGNSEPAQMPGTGSSPKLMP
jgi:ferredoxin